MDDLERCDYTGKLIYVSRNQARKAVKRMVAKAKLKKHRGPPPEIYACKACRYFHIGRTTRNRRWGKGGSQARARKFVDDDGSGEVVPGADG